MTMRTLLLVFITLAISSCSEKEKSEGNSIKTSCESFSPINGKVYDVSVSDLLYSTGFISIENKFLCRFENPYKDEFEKIYLDRGLVEKCDFLVRSYRVMLEKDSSTKVHGLGDYQARETGKEEISNLQRMISSEIDSGHFRFCSI